MIQLDQAEVEDAGSSLRALTGPDVLEDSHAGIPRIGAVDDYIELDPFPPLPIFGCAVEVEFSGAIETLGRHAFGGGVTVSVLA